ncbi:MAG TPA: hypothetical protein VIX86_18705 [Streptosporangiaceae bacterium]
MSERPKLDLSTVQVSASVLAAITGAVAMSYVGVGGTILGAGVASLASTTSIAIYRHYLARTHQRMREAAQARLNARRWADWAGARAGTHPGGSAAAAPASAPAAPAPASSPAAPPPPIPADQEQTQVLPMPPARDPADAEKTHVYGIPQASPAAGIAGDAAAGPSDQDTITSFAAATGGPETADMALPPAGGDDASPAATGSGGSAGRPRWVMYVLVTVGVFVVAMAGITLVEAAAGKPLDTIVWHRHGSGTTMGSLMGGSKSTPTPSTTQPATGQATPTPTQTQPTATATPTASPPTATQSPTPGPSSTGSPAAAPSASP